MKDAMRKVVIIVFVLFGTLETSGQMLELPKSVLSPNASSLGRYGDIPMDLSTGRANIGIPLYSLNEGGIPLDISLKYDTGGVRVNDVPGWVGQNWALNAGGVITRTVKGTTFDECNVPTNSISHMQKGYYYYLNKLNVSNWNSPNYMIDLIRRSKDPDNIQISEINADYEPDIFTFNFMGTVGKFFLGEDGEWKVLSKSNLKVVIDMADNVQPMNFTSVKNCNNDYVFPKVIGKITIYDDKGNKFIFGGTQETIEYAFPDFFNQSSSKIVSSAWYLKEVYNNFNQLIYSFNYERGDYIAQFYDNNTWGSFTKEFGGSWSDVYCNIGTGIRTNTVLSAGQLVAPSYLKKITTRAGINVNFSSYENNSLKYGASDLPIIDTYQMILYYNQGPSWASIDDCLFYFIRRQQDGISLMPNVNGGNLHIYPYLDNLKWRKLTDIQITGTNATPLKKIKFKYNDNPNSRLRLDGVSIDNLSKYDFEYNNFDNLPHFSSLNIDAYGYYKSSPYSLDVYNPQNHESTRQIDITAVKYGTLSKIVYPTGGFSKFEYEPNSYSKYVSNDLSLANESGLAGGVRIAKLSDYSDALNKKEISYEYVTGIDSQISSGILLQKNIFYINNYLVPTYNGIPYYETRFSTSPMIYLANTLGSQFEYSTVIEKEIGNGYTINRFNTYADYPDNISSDVSLGNTRNIFNPHSEYSFKRGTLNLKQFYNQQKLKIKEEEFLYTESSVKKAKAFTYLFFKPCPAGGTLSEYVIGGTAYNMFFSDFNLTTKIIKTFNENGDSLIETESFNYVDRENFGDNFLRNKTKTTTNHATLKEEYQYTFDKTATAPYNSLSGKRQFSVIKKDNSLDMVPLSSSQIEYAQLPVYNNNANITSNAQIFPQKFSEAKGTNPLEEKLTIDKYDVEGNILQAHRADGTYIFYFYAYNNRYPIMKIEGPETIPPGKTPFATYASELRTLVENLTPNMSQILSKQFGIVSHYPEHVVTCYTYRPNVGVTSIMSTNASVEFYNYDSTGRLISIKDINGKVLKDFSYTLANQ